MKRPPFQTQLATRTRNETQQTYDLPKGLDYPMSFIYKIIPQRIQIQSDRMKQMESKSEIEVKAQK